MGNFSSLGNSPSIFDKKILVYCQLEGLNTLILLKVQFLQEHVSDFFLELLFVISFIRIKVEKKKC